ncbi:hypothetical protein WKI65_43040 [Streptomyces sp. MS1.AVA.3]|uniref:hypothetical protein n=1 Tax=Streptomyces decoyicus TaxID=249567 RepID=UPI0030C3C2F7
MRQSRSVAVLNQEPPKKPQVLLRVLARKNAELRSAAEAQCNTYASVRWMHAWMCRDLGSSPDELTLGQSLVAVVSKIPTARSAGRMVDAT